MHAGYQQALEQAWRKAADLNCPVYVWCEDARVYVGTRCPNDTPGLHDLVRVTGVATYESCSPANNAPSPKGHDREK